MEWADWSRWFLELYGFGEWFAPTVTRWVDDVFIPGGTTPAEMREAALAVARSGPPRKPNEILPALLDEVRRQRADRIQAEEEQARLGGADVTGCGRCDLCDGQGWVIVPHCPQPERAQAKGYLATHCVRCRCHAGGRLGKTAQTAMSIDQYEQGNPGWREQAAWWKSRQRAEALAADSTGQMARLVDRLIEGAKKRERR